MSAEDVALLSKKLHALATVNREIVERIRSRAAHSKHFYRYHVAYNEFTKKYSIAYQTEEIPGALRKSSVP